MSAPFEVTLDVTPALRDLQSVANKLGNLGPVHRQIGELLVDSSKGRFANSQAPDGTTWQALSQATLSAYVGTFGKSNFGKSGRINSKGAARVMGRKPLVDSGTLARTIFYTVSADGNELAVGSPMEYAAVQNFGQPKGASGAMKNGRPIPWGDIPAREFIGLSNDDTAMMERQYTDYIASFSSA